MLMVRVIAILVVSLLLAACGAPNRPVELGDGETHNGSLSSVNGVVQIGNDCRVTGDVANVNGAIRVGERARLGAVRNVNGGIRLGRGSEAARVETVNGRVELGDSTNVAQSVQTVNGNVTLGQNSRVGGDIRSVNGRIVVDAGSEISGKVRSVNGSLRLTAVTAGRVKTSSGSIEILEGSIVREGLLVRASRNGDRGRPPRVVIGADSQVLGEMVFERAVELHVHDSAIIGEVTGAEVIRFSGSAPR